MSGYTDSFIAGHGVLEPEGTHLLRKPFTEGVLMRKLRELSGIGKKFDGRQRKVRRAPKIRPLAVPDFK